MTELEFNDLTKQLLNDFISSPSIGFFLNKVSKLLDNPVLIVDGAYKVLANSSMEGVCDCQWEKAIASGYYSDEFIAEIIKNFRKNDRLVFTEEPFDRRNALSQYTRTICKLMQDGVTMGSLVVLDVNPLSPEKKNLLPLISRLCMRFPLAVKEQLGPGDERFYSGIFLDLILGEIRTSEMLYSRLIPSGIELPDKFQLYTVALKSYSRIAMSALQHNFQRLFPEAWMIYYNNHFLILRFENCDVPPEESCIKEIREMLDQYFLTLCCGECFDNILSLRSHYHFNLSALKLAEMTGCTQTVIYYNDYRFLDIVLNASNHMNTVLENLACRKVMDIRAWDRQFGTNYFETLYTYLTSEKSFADTAEKLWTHRNTIVYRIRKIKELFDIDFDSFEAYFPIIYSCMIMKAKDKMDAEKEKLAVTH